MPHGLQKPGGFYGFLTSCSIQRRPFIHAVSIKQIDEVNLMSLTISCPTAAQVALRAYISTKPPHSVEALTKAFLLSVNVTEARVRELALAKQLPLSGVVRALVLKKYPDIAPLWPKPSHSAAKVAGFAGRSRSPSKSLSEAVKHLIPFLNHEEDGQTTRRAREYALANGAVLVDGKYQLK